MSTPRTKPRPKSARSRASAAVIHHLHTVIDEELHEGIKAHACKLEGVPNTKEQEERLNLSASVRDLLRRALKINTAAA